MQRRIDLHWTIQTSRSSLKTRDDNEPGSSDKVQKPRLQTPREELTWYYDVYENTWVIIATNLQDHLRNAEPSARTKMIWGTTQLDKRSWRSWSSMTNSIRKTSRAWSHSRNKCWKFQPPKRSCVDVNADNEIMRNVVMPSDPHCLQGNETLCLFVFNKRIWCISIISLDKYVLL